MKKGPKTRRTATGISLPGVRGKPIKIAASFETAVDALLAVPSEKKKRKR